MRPDDHTRVARSGGLAWTTAGSASLAAPGREFALSMVRACALLAGILLLAGHLARRAGGADPTGGGALPWARLAAAARAASRASELFAALGTARGAGGAAAT